MRGRNALRTKSEYKKYALTSTTQLVALALIGVLIGVALVYATSNNLGNIGHTTTVNLPQETVTVTQQQTMTQQQTQTVTQAGTATVITRGSGTSSSTISIPTIGQENVVLPVSTPASWNNNWSALLGVQLVAEYNSSGPAAWSASAHPTVYVTTNGMGYGGYMSGLSTPGLCIIDALTYQVVACRQYDIAGQTVYNEPHGLGVSMDGRYIYLPTGNVSSSNDQTKGELLVIDAQTLLIHQIIESPASSGMHHIEAVRLWDGVDAVIVQPFWFGSPALTGEGGTPSLAAAGGSFYLLDTTNDNTVLGGFTSSQLALQPYLAQPDPDGLHLFVSSRSTTGGAGATFVINMQTWGLTQTYTAPPGDTPNMFAFSDNGQYTWATDNSGDHLIEYNDATQQQVAIAGSPCAGPYGVTLNYNQTLAYLVGKGESHGNAGKDLGEVNAVTMQDVNDYFLGGSIRGDHAILDPVHTNEIWISSNSAFEDVAFNVSSNTIDAIIPQTGSSHNGAFVTYTVLATGQWQGMLQADNTGLHGSALVAQQSALHVTSVMYGSQTYKTEAQRALPGEPV